MNIAAMEFVVLVKEKERGGGGRGWITKRLRSQVLMAEGIMPYKFNLHVLKYHGREGP